MQAFAHACDAIAATSKRLEKIALAAEYLATLSSDDVDAAARFFQGRVLPPRDPQAPIGHRTILDAAARSMQLAAVDVRAAVRQFGEIGEALASLYAPPLDLGLFRDALTPATVRDRLREAARYRGGQAATKRGHVVEKLISDCSDARELAAVTKILTGELRIGLREGLILDAIALAFARDIESVRRAANADADFGLIARAAREDKLSTIEPAYGVPIAAMLASPILFGSAYDELADGEWVSENKFDGIRAQLQVSEAGIRLFSRTGNPIEQSFPEIVSSAKTLFTQPVIVDGEIIASRDGRPLPFRALQPRIARKDPDAALQAEVPVEFQAFDLLALGKDMLLDIPWSQRRERLSMLCRDLGDGGIRLSATTPIEEPRAENLESLFAQARTLGNEGLLLKRTDSLYAAGRRGKSWLKLKKELATLDVVVVGVEWGHGKRAKMLSDYTFAIRGDDDRLLTIGKAYSGLTDAEIIANTTYFQAHMTGEMLTKRAYAVTPLLVIETAFDVLAESSLHASGFALRFPRIVRIRDDKSVADVTTLAEVKEIYRLMTHREAGTQHRPAIEADDETDEITVPDRS